MRVQYLLLYGFFQVSNFFNYYFLSISESSFIINTIKQKMGITYIRESLKLKKYIKCVVPQSFGTSVLYFYNSTDTRNVAIAQ